jgi:hypothetical protein
MSSNVRRRTVLPNEDQEYLIDDHLAKINKERRRKNLNRLCFSPFALEAIEEKIARTRMEKRQP